ncbi:hypothetical protein BTJ40_16580 [Microbulbifer sp. A4B17]|uniref:hypothetical protein n=1 Tax=Microbulbifer sp. A4B17 TaxID=359370 RepID=UPI000D52B109|nr:hypothetical protein [Microbulbifer sp. A4B17]AWF82312.1 hypothetical protein BTJ40_16580 [Microbulbifer sp. A4B17]
MNTFKRLPFQLDRYLVLVNWRAGHLDPRKRGAISHDIFPVLKRMGISPKHWLYLNRNFESRFKGLVSQQGG